MSVFAIFISVFPQLSSAKETSQHDTLVVLYSDGTVNWVPRAIITSGCTMDYEYFPFDTQVCVIKVGSWTLDGSKVCAKPLISRKIRLFPEG